jgi:hypothetical protein
MLNLTMPRNALFSTAVYPLQLCYLSGRLYSNSGIYRDPGPLS